MNPGCAARLSEFNHLGRVLLIESWNHSIRSLYRLGVSTHPFEFGRVSYAAKLVEILPRRTAICDDPKGHPLERTDQNV